MKHWWVNQNQTYAHEVGGGYLCSPKTNSNVSKNRFYDAMTETQAGDVVFSFCDTLIKAVGVVTGPCQSAPKPTEFGSTRDTGTTRGGSCLSYSRRSRSRSSQGSTWRSSVRRCRTGTATASKRKRKPGRVPRAGAGGHGSPIKAAAETLSRRNRMTVISLWESFASAARGLDQLPHLVVAQVAVQAALLVEPVRLVDDQGVVGVGLVAHEGA